MDQPSAQATLCEIGTQLPLKGHSPQFSAHVYIVAKQTPISATAEHLLCANAQKVPIFYNGPPLSP